MANKKKGFGQGSGSDLVDAVVAADPMKNLPTILKIEMNKFLKGRKSAKKMKNGGCVMKGRGGSFKGTM